MARLSLALLLCSPSILLARAGAEALWHAALADQVGAELATDFRTQARPPEQTESNAGDDQDEPPPVGTPPVCPAGASLSFLLLSDKRERLPDPPEFLRARLRAPPLA